MKDIRSILSVAARNAKKIYLSLQPIAIICNELKLIYYPIPKVASSTIKSYLLSNMESSVPYSPWDKYNIQGHDFITASKHDLKKYKNYISFTVIRNPYERILSCYRDKIVNEFQSFGHIHYGFTRYNTILNKNLFHENMDFSSFLEAVSKIPDILSDEHFRSQSRFLPLENSKVKVDYLLELESLNTQFHNMTIRENLPQFTEINVNKSGQHYSSGSFSKTDYIRINSRYSLDLRLLPYVKQTDSSSVPQLENGA